LKTSRTSTWRLFPPEHVEYDKGHGRIEERKIWTSSELKGYSNFPHLEQVARIERTTTKLDGTPMRHEVVHAVTSQSADKADAKQLLQQNRGHWCIENQVHYVRDVTLGEDLSRTRKGKSPQMMATLRNLLISLLRFVGATNIAQAIRSCSNKPVQALRLLGL